MPIPENVKQTLYMVAEGAAVTFSSNYSADELADDPDMTDRGERLISGKLLERDFNGVLDGFSAGQFIEMINDDREEVNVAAVLDTFGNLDLPAEQCFEETWGPHPNKDMMFKNLDEWRQSAAAKMLLEKFVTAIKLKIFAIRFRKRMYSPTGPLFCKTQANFKRRCTDSVVLT